MLERKPERNTYYYGSDTHRYINEVIHSDGDVLIVSPYLDRYYADMLSSKPSRNRLYIISSSLDRDVQHHLSKKKSRLPIAGYVALSAVILYLMYLIGISGMPLAISLIPVVVGTIKYGRIHNNITLKIPKQFVHAKMYVSDSMAITGSANLTYAGTHRNIEHIDIIYNNDEISRLKEQFWSMWNKL